MIETLVPDGSSEPMIRRAFAVTNRAFQELSYVDFWYQIDDKTGSAITTGTKAELLFEFDCNIVQGALLADQVGSIKVDAWVAAWASFPPTNAYSICGAAELEISAAQKAVDTTLSGWSTHIDKGDTMILNVDSCATIERCLYHLRLERG